MTEPSNTLTLLDGGMGRELMRIGAPFRQPEWSALALTEEPERVVEAHRNFIEAGSQLITTNSYAVVPFHIGDDRFANEAEGLAALAGSLARQAAQEANRSVPIIVAGCLPPLFGSYLPERFDEGLAPTIIDPLIRGQAPYVDLWLAETLSCIAEAQAVRHGLDRANDNKPLWISYTLSDAADGTLRSGESVSAALAATVGLNAQAILFNCSQAESITVALKMIAPLVPTHMQIGAYANRFVSAHSSTGESNAHLAGLRDDLSPSQYCEFVDEWISLGASLIGGCCGMTPDHIAAIALVLSK